MGVAIHGYGTSLHPWLPPCPVQTSVFSRNCGFCRSCTVWCVSDALGHQPTPTTSKSQASYPAMEHPIVSCNCVDFPAIPSPDIWVNQGKTSQACNAPCRTCAAIRSQSSCLETSQMLLVLAFKPPNTEKDATFCRKSSFCIDYHWLLVGISHSPPGYSKPSLRSPMTNRSSPSGPSDLKNHPKMDFFLSGNSREKIEKIFWPEYHRMLHCFHCFGHERSVPCCRCNSKKIR